MKIPQILAQAEIPASVPGALPQDGTAPYQALKQVGEAITKFSINDQLVKATEERHRQEKISESMNAFSDIAGAMDQLTLDLTTGTRDAYGNEVEPPASHKDYLQRWEQRRNQIVSQRLAQIPDAETKRAAQLLVDRDMISRSSTARMTSHRMFLDSEQATHDRFRASQLTIAAFGLDQRARDEAVAAYAASVALKTPSVWSRAQAEKLIAGFTEDAAVMQAQRVLRETPELFDATRYTDQITAPKLGVLMEQFHKRMKERDRELEQDWNEAKRLALSEYFWEARRGDFTTQDWERLNTFWNFDPQQQAVIEAAMKQDVEDDEAAMTEIRRMARDPDLNQNDADTLFAYFKAKKISGTTYDRFAGIFAATIRANEAAARARGAEERAVNRDAERERKQGIRDERIMLRTDMRVDDPISNATGLGTAAYGKAIQRFDDLVENGMDPVQARRTAVVEFIPHLEQAARAMASVLRASRPVGVNVLEDLGTFTQAQAKWGIATRDEYNRIVRDMKMADDIDRRSLELKQQVKGLQDFETERERVRKADEERRRMEGMVRQPTPLRYPELPVSKRPQYGAPFGGQP